MSDNECATETESKEETAEQKEQENAETDTDKPPLKVCRRMLVDAPDRSNAGLDGEEVEEFQ
jgi:hypothetical protein